MNLTDEQSNLDRQAPVVTGYRTRDGRKLVSIAPTVKGATTMGFRRWVTANLCIEPRIAKVRSRQSEAKDI